MHRGSSKGTGRPRPVPEALPLSASPAPSGIRVEVSVARGRSNAPPSVHWVPNGTSVRALLRQLGHPPEGSAVLVGGVSVPLDTPIDSPMRLVVVPTFSGG